MSAKDLVKAFYNSDIVNDSSIVPKFFHEECQLHWSSSHGFMILKFNDIEKFFEGTRKSYTNLRFEFTHLIEENSTLATRHTLFAQTIENPESETVLAHFSAIWEVKDNKRYSGYEISHQADETNLESINSYAKRKV